MATTLVRDNDQRVAAAVIDTAEGHVDLRGDASHPKLSIVLWIVQALLTVLFLFTGSMKLLMPTDILAAQTPLPVEFVRFLGLCEVAGALGLICCGGCAREPSQALRSTGGSRRRKSTRE